jgi:myo-inositol-1(or 4)-monophosphatase
MRLGAGPTFVVDPIDGTVNFVHGNPYVCISLALCVDKRPVVGVVYNPFTDMLYTAIKGGGSFLNRRTRLPLKAPPLPLTGGLNRALVAVEWGSDRLGNNWDVKLRTYRNLAEQGRGMVHSLRSLGSAALNFCAVAAGTIDIYWEAGCWAWDVAAGWLILQEAGGLVADANPGGWAPTIDGRRYMAVRACDDSKSQREIVEQFWSLVVGKFDYDT